MKLRKAYQDIADSFGDSASSVEFVDLVNAVVHACQSLADKPPKELTLKEIDELWPANYSRPIGDYSAPRRFIAAHIAKQREPIVVKFRAARNQFDSRIEMFSTESPRNAEWHGHWEWLDDNGKPQICEVKL